MAAFKLRELEPEIILAHFIFAIFFFGSNNELSQFTLFVPWLMPIADERVSVQVKLRDPLRTCAIPERFGGVFHEEVLYHVCVPLPLIVRLFTK